MGVLLVCHSISSFVGGSVLVCAVVAYPSLRDESRAGTILLKTRRHVANIIVCVGEEDSEIAAIARMAGAQVLTSARRTSKCPVRPLLEAVAARNPDILVLNCDDACDPNCIPRLLRPLENDSVDVVEAPWSGFRAFSR